MTVPIRISEDQILVEVLRRVKTAETYQVSYFQAKR